MRTLGIIPARGGSKGIPGKNLVDLGGRPLIEWTLAAAQASTLDTVVVSTDDDFVAAVVEEYGVQVIRRPKQLATDNAKVSEAAQHVRDTLAKARQGFDILVLLQPTSPFRTAEDIDDALALMDQTGCESVVSVVDCGERQPARMCTQDAEGRPRWLDNDKRWARRQDLPAVYLRAGSIYATREIHHHSFVSGDCRLLVVPQLRAVNIDGPDDLTLARMIAATEHQPDATLRERSTDGSSNECLAK